MTVAAIKITKAKAFGLADFVEVELTRTAEYITGLTQWAKLAMAVPEASVHRALNSHIKDPLKHVVAIAIGSNMGDRYANIENALRQMDNRHEIINVTDTSFLYESEPMYVLDQDKFLNCVILVETELGPAELLTFLKDIETAAGRTKSLRNGPRALDLDIIFYDSLVLDNRKDGGDGSGENELVVPHLRLIEREFVLRPLHDLIPDYIHPTLRTTVRSLLEAYYFSHPPTLTKILPFPSPPRYPNIPPTLWPLSLKTYLMATINSTPDSFSSSAPSTPTSALAEALAATAAGADVIDVGGYSTRPGARPVSVEDELKRVVPIVRKIREHGITLPISVDTFRPAVLRAAVEAGANCLNDVTALADHEQKPNVSDSGMRRGGEMAMAVRDLGVPVVMMHSRGAHHAGENKNYGPGGVVDGVQRELGRSVTHALQSGIRRWNLLIDPGYGFSKTVDDNLALLRRFRELSAPRPNRDGRVNPLEGFPTLAGLSRKSFLGKLTGRDTEPQDRNWATAAAVTAAVQQGVDVVRVHNVAEMRDVLRIADAVWRRVRL